jgi:CubicO group peptidase (beta-lactamase class C family)
LVHSKLFDLPGFEIALMHDGKIDGKQALSRKVVTALTTPHADIPGARLEYGYGLEGTRVEPRRVASWIWLLPRNVAGAAGRPE